MTVEEFVVKLAFEVGKKEKGQVKKEIGGLKDLLGKSMKDAIKIGTIVAALKQLNKMVEEYTKVNEQIAAATKGLENQDRVFRDILTSANETKTAYKDMASIVSSLVKSRSKIFDGDLEQAEQFAETLAKAGRSAGLSSQEIKALGSTLTSTFNSGMVSLGTFDAITQQLPQIEKALEQVTGKTKQELAALSSAGGLSATQLYKAFIYSTDEINEAFENLDYTVADSWNDFKNTIGFAANELDDFLGLTEIIARTIQLVSNTLEGLLIGLADGGDLVGFTDQMKFIGDMIKDIGEWVKEILYPIGKILGEVFAILNPVFELIKAIWPVVKGIVDLAVELFKVIMNLVEVAINPIIMAVQFIANGIKNVIGPALKWVMDTFIKPITDALHLLNDTFNKLDDKATDASSESNTGSGKALSESFYEEADMMSRAFNANAIPAPATMSSSNVSNRNITQNINIPITNSFTGNVNETMVAASKTLANDENEVYKNLANAIRFAV